MEEKIGRTVFVDGAARVQIVAGVVRIDFGEVGEGEGEEAPKTLEPTLRMAMPLDGFLRTFGVFQNVVEKMEKDGLISRAEKKRKDKSK